MRGAASGGAGRGIDEETLGALMRAYQAGELAAFDGVYAALAPELRRYLGARERDPARVEDLVQETFLRVHRARRSWDPALPVRPWAFAIAKHVLLMSWRTRARRDAREVPLDPARPPEAAATAGAAERRRLLEQLLARVAPARRTPLVLHHLRGLGFREIGRRLGLGEGAARVRASRALSELRTALGRRGAGR